MKKNAFIAITTSVVLSALILILTTSVGFTTWFSRFGALNSLFKETSFYVAQSCLEKAKLKIAQNSAYVGNETINVGSYSCFIYAIENPQAGQKVIKTRAQVSQDTTNLKLTVNHPQLTTISLEEVPKF